MRPALYKRIPTDVEAMQLEDSQDLRLADLWLRAHGIPVATCHPALTGRGLVLPKGPRSFQIAHLGQWLTRDLAAGDFTVHDDDRFNLLHRREVAA